MTTATATITIQATRIIGTDVVIFSAWEPFAGHGTVTYTDAGKLGKIGTRPLPADLEALPAFSAERSAAVGAWHEAQYQEAYAAILAEGAVIGKPSMGEITARANDN